MPLAGWCDVDNAWVWVNDDGSCVNGHSPEHVTRVYDTDTQNAPPPAPVQQQTYPSAPPVAPPAYSAQSYQTTAQPGSNRATLSLVFGIGSILCCFPIVTIPMAIAGIIYGMQGLQTDKRGLAMAGLVLSILGLVGSLVNAVLGAYFALQEPEFLNQLMQTPR